MTVRGWAAVTVVALALAACGLLPVPGPVVEIDPGITPRMSAGEVTEQAIARIHQMEEIAGRVLAPPRVLRVTGTLNGTRIVWRVAAAGTFTSVRGPRVAALPAADSGWWLISDADGSVLEFGFP